MTASDINPANDATPIFQAHGTMDPMVPIERGQSARDALESRDYRIEWHEYPMQHAVHPDEIQDIGRWLADRLSS